MGSKKKKSSSSPAYTPVPRVTQGQLDQSLSGLQQSQEGFIGKLLGPLIARGESAMASNPGLTNFMDKVGSAKDSMDNALLGPGSLLSQFDEAIGYERNPQPEEPAQPNPYGLTPEQLAQLSKYGGVNGKYPTTPSTPYNINNDMRKRFHR
jgi:hypothetical protein